MLKEFMEKIFSDYQSAKKDKYVDHPLNSFIKTDFPNNLSNSIKNIGQYEIIGYPGEGNWTSSPYIAIFDPKITNSLESGFYVLYIFTQDSKKVYLSLNQGLKNNKGLDPSDFLVELSNNSANIRNQLNLPDAFETDKLHGLGKHYYFKRLEYGNICSKSYDYGDLPSEEELFSDLNQFLMIYKEFQDDKGDPTKLSDEQIKELLKWFVNSSETYRNWMPKRRHSEKMNHTWIQPEKIKEMADEELKNHYLDYFNSGTGDKQNIIAISRDRIIRDKNFRDSLIYLLNEDVDIKKRINDLLDTKNEKHIEGMGKALITAFLMDFKPDKYCLWNGKTEDGLKALGWNNLYRTRGDSGGDIYLKVLELLKKLRDLVPELELKFLDVDLFLHVIAAEEEGIKELNRIRNLKINIKGPLELIFKNLPLAKKRNEKPKNHEVGRAFLNIKDVILNIADSVYPEKSFNSVAYYQANGDWYNKPYVYIENKENKDKYGHWDQHYVGFLFTEDLDGVIIAIKQSKNYARNLLNAKLGEYDDEDLEKYLKNHAKTVRNYLTNFFEIKNDFFKEDSKKTAFTGTTIYGKYYDKNNLPSNEQIISDFKKLLNLFSQLKPDENGGFPLETTFFEYLADNGYFFDQKLVENFLLSLKVKPFVILTGNSGTGKTKVAQLFAQYLSKADKSQDFSFVTEVKVGQSAKSGGWALNKVNSLEYFPGLKQYEKTYDIKVDNAEGKGTLTPWLYMFYDKAEGNIKKRLETLNPEKKVKLEIIISKKNESRYEIVPVGANWTENRHILGFYNVITDEYQKTGSLDLILDAQNDSEKPYFLILDEMNLSHVERYFSDFLSAMESDEEIELYQANKNTVKDDEITYIPPEKIKLPENLMVIGTVNVDETTYMFSPKVLDRANTLEFLTQPAEDYMSGSPEYSIKGDLDYLQTPLSDVDIENEVNIRTENIFQLKNRLEGVKTVDNKDLWNVLSNNIAQFQDILKEADFDFGFRTINEIIRFMCVAWKYENTPPKWDNWERYFDAQIMQKMLPKLHGSQKELGKVLEELEQECVKANFPLSTKKIQRMRKTLTEKRYVSFTG